MSVFNVNVVVISAQLYSVEMRVNLSESRVEQLARNNAGIINLALLYTTMHTVHVAMLHFDLYNSTAKIKLDYV